VGISVVAEVTVLDAVVTVVLDVVGVTVVVLDAVVLMAERDEVAVDIVADVPETFWRQNVHANCVVSTSTRLVHCWNISQRGPAAT
jgi:hypothetical protein